MKFHNTNHYLEPARRLGRVFEEGASTLEVVLTKKEAIVGAGAAWQFAEVRMTRRKLRSFVNAILEELDR